MHRSLRSIVTALAIGMAVVVGAPAAAQASTIYPPVDACSTSSATAQAGQAIEFSCTSGTFGASEPITITVTGENGEGATFAVVRFAISTGSTTRTSDAAGALRPVAITLPQNASGVYNIAAVSPSSAGGAASTSIVDADGVPRTGGESGQLLGIWIGGGALVAAGAIVLITLALRRRGHRDD